MHTFKVRNPKEIGDRSFLMVVTALIERGLDVFVPMGENSRVDLVTWDGQNLRKVHARRAGSGMVA